MLGWYLHFVRRKICVSIYILNIRQLKQTAKDIARMLSIALSFAVLPNANGHKIISLFKSVTETNRDGR
jgi:hypothetical protein